VNERSVDFESDWFDLDGYGYDDYLYDHVYDYDDPYDYDYDYSYDDLYMDYPYDDNELHDDEYFLFYTFEDRDRRQQTDRRARADEREGRDRSKAEIRGTLDGWTTVDLKGQRDAHTLIRVRLEDGSREVINLGPNVEVEKLRLSDGKRIAAYGPEGSIDGNDVLMAEKILVDERVIRTPEWTPQGADRSDRRADRTPQRDSMDRGRLHPQAEVVRRVIEGWPDESRRAAEAMLKKYGKPAGVTPQMLVWRNTGPFVKTVVHKRPVDHDFPMPHQDVLEQFVNFKVPADKMDELAKFDGSVIVFRTDGLMSARCHKEPMNILALNLAARVVKGETSVEEARRTYAETARKFEQGDRPDITQRLTFESNGSGNADATDVPGTRMSRRNGE